ncbi:MAG: TonB-dependent receptor [Henriciella sp.]|nr:TonB-dependent receptor [Henriciella sp.]
MKRTIGKSSLKASASFVAFVAMSASGLNAVSAQEVDDEEEVSVQETVIVTATRRAEGIQDIPLNIAAVGSDQIEQQGFGDISELASYVPGLNVSDQGGRDGNRIVVRGLNAEPVQAAFGQPDGGGTVATYVGEIPLYVDLRLNDLQRVEVLLGPQGTLYGAGTMGGAIRYIPNKPEFDGLTFDVRTDIYSYSEGDGISSDTGFTLNIPVSDQFAIRGSIDYLNDDGFIDYPFVVQEIGVSEPDPDFSDAAALAANFNPADDVNTEETLSGRIAARWQPIDAVDATATYYFQNQENGGRNTSGRRGVLMTDDYSSAQRVLEPNERDVELFALEVVADLGFAELTSATGYGEVTENGQRDQTDLLITLEYSYEAFPTFTAFTFEDDKTESFSQEVRLVSTGDYRYNWIVGAFYNENIYNGLSSEFTPGYTAFAGGTRPDLNDLEYFSADRQELEETAIFGEFGYDITDQWDVTIGARFYDYTFQTGNQTNFPIFEGPDFQPFVLGDLEANVPLDPTTLQDEQGELFKVNTSYTFDNGNLIYATFSQGYRLGGGNAGGDCPPFDPNSGQGLCLLASGQQFGPDPVNDVRQLDERAYVSDTVDNYEVGVKTTWLDGALILNGSVYFIEWTDPQLAATSVNAGTSITVNAGAAETMGLDMSGRWQVNDNFNLRGSFSYTKAELTEDVPDLVTTIGPPGFSTVFEAGQTGDRLPGSPETQFSIFGSYVHPLANGNDVTIEGGYAWQGDVLDEAGARGNSLTLPSFGRASIAVGYETDTWSATAYVDNLFDELAETSVAANALFNQTINGANVRSFRTNVLPPRTIGVRLSYNFE